MPEHSLFLQEALELQSGNFPIQNLPMASKEMSIPGFLERSPILGVIR
jgi:hypothetical protein